MMNFSPRLGVSWQPVKHMVVRAGGGFYYGPSVQMPSGPFEDSRWLPKFHEHESKLPECG